MRKGPLVTLVAVAALGIGLVAVNMSKQSDDSAPAASVSATSPAETVTSSDAPASGTTEPTRLSPGETPAVSFPEIQDYVGAADGSGITVSVTVEGDQAVAYLCDGASVEAWLTGTAVDGALDLTNPRGATMTGRLSGSDVSGTVALPAREPIAFTASPVAPPSGLYVQKTDEGRQSWIVDGTDVVGVARDPQGNTSPAAALPADAIKVSGSDTDVF